MRTIEEHFTKELQQEKFAMLVSARVNEILSNNAKVLDFNPAGGVHYTPEQEALMFADTIARAVCAHLINTGEEK